MVEAHRPPDNIWKLLSLEQRKEMLESWKKRAEELKEKLEKLQATNESKRQEIVSALDSAIQELARLIEGIALESNVEADAVERRGKWKLARMALLNATKGVTDLLNEEPKQASEYSALQAEIRRFENAVQSVANAPDAE